MMSSVNRQRGSVILLVIGLLTVIAMLGSMLLLVARLDRQTSQAMATVAPERHVADGVLDRLLADRLADLYIGPAGTVYTGLSGNPLIAERQTIDYPADGVGYDNTLATGEPNANGRWDHVSDPNALGYELAAVCSDVPVTDPNLVDTDGDGTGDAWLFPIGVLNRDGEEFYAAVRMIDASGLVNVNTGGTTTRPAAGNRIMGPVDVSLQGPPSPNGLLLDPAAGSVVSERTGRGPYDTADMLAARWFGQPDTDAGRLAKAVADPSPDPNDPNYQLRAYGRFLTTISAYRPISVFRTNLDGAVTLKVNPNYDSARLIYDAFLALLNSQNPDPNNPVVAGQLTVNLIDYTDGNDDVTRADLSVLDPNQPSGTFIYGIERHPFVSKVFLKRRFDTVGGMGELLPRISALELINPYSSPIDLGNYYLTGLGGTIATTADLAGKKIYNNGGRFVFYSDDSVRIDPNLPNDCKLKAPALDVSGAVKLMWRNPASSPNDWSVCIDQTTAVTDTDCPAPDAATPERWRARYRDDELSRARYTLMSSLPSEPHDPADPSAAYHDYTDPNGLGWMGQANPTDAAAAVPGSPTPIYIRNGRMISLGDMTRLLSVGPTDTTPVTSLLPYPPVDQPLQLVPFAKSALPVSDTVPVGCALPEFFTLVQPNAGSDVRGLINVNTASWKVLGCLPALSSTGAKDVRDKLVAEIIAYRDLRDNGPRGGVNYINRNAVITGLRTQPGLADAGEIGIPLRLGLGAALNEYKTQNIHPYPYALLRGSGIADDDGLRVDLSTGPPYYGVMDDPVKEHVLYSWLINQVTVRSNTYIAYIRVQLGEKVGAAARHYVALIDRGDCFDSPTAPPRVLMFTELQ